jgi:hypothetical protein
MIVLVTVVETWVSLQPLRFVETASLSWRLAVEAIPREAERSEVALLGDSLVKIGVIPEVVREGSGRSTYNFAMAQAPAPATYFVLRRLIDAGGKPSAIVIDFKPSVLAGGPKYSLRHWQTILSPREAFELAADSKSPALLCEIGLGRLLPSYRDRNEIRQAVLSFFHGEIAPNYSTNRLALRNWSVNRGAHVNSPRNQFSGEVSAEIHRKLLSDGWKPHKINTLYVDRLLSLAEAHQIPVYWLIPPLAPELQERREHSGVDDAFVSFVRSMQARHPRVTVVDGRRSGYDASTFADHTHLNPRGAVALSHDLATLIKQGASPERWVSLPRFLDGTSTVPIEDIDETRMAIESGALVR